MSVSAASQELASRERAGSPGQPETRAQRPAADGLVGPGGASDPDEIPVLVSHGAHFQGLVCFSGSARIEGEIVGDVIGESGTLLLGPGARIRGNVQVDELVVGGRLEGDVRARMRLEVLATGEIEGQLQTPLLTVADGGRIQARCATSRPEPDAPGEEPEEAPLSL